MWGFRIGAPPVGSAIAGPRQATTRLDLCTITGSGEFEDGRAFFGNDMVRAFRSP
jgi:hypothetical protein